MKKIITLIAIVTVAIFFTTPILVSASTVSNWDIVKGYCHKNYKGYKIVKVKFDDKRLSHRTNKKIVYVEKVVSKSNGDNSGTIDNKWYIAYNKKVKKGKKVTSYCIYNPNTNYCDDVVAVVDNKTIR